MSSIPKPHLIEKPLEELEIFELIAKVIPHRETSTIARIAKLYGCSEQLVRKWRNDPSADAMIETDPHGRRSPVDNLLQFLDALNAISPARADLVWARLEYEYADMRRLQGDDTKMRKWRALKKINELSREITAISELNGECDDG